MSARKLNLLEECSFAAGITGTYNPYYSVGFIKPEEEPTTRLWVDSRLGTDLSDNTYKAVPLQLIIYATRRRGKR